MVMRATKPQDKGGTSPKSGPHPGNCDGGHWWVGAGRGTHSSQRFFSNPHSPRTPSRTPFLTLHVTHHLRHHTIHKQHGWPPLPPPPLQGFFILPTAFPNPHIHPGGKGGQPPASKLPYCSKPVAFTMRIKHIRYIISLHLALPRMLCLNVIA